MKILKKLALAILYIIGTGFIIYALGVWSKIICKLFMFGFNSI